MNKYFIYILLLFIFFHCSNERYNDKQYINNEFNKFMSNNLNRYFKQYIDSTLHTLNIKSDFILYDTIDNKVVYLIPKLNVSPNRYFNGLTIFITDLENKKRYLIINPIYKNEIQSNIEKMTKIFKKNNTNKFKKLLILSIYGYQNKEPKLYYLKLNNIKVLNKGKDIDEYKSLLKFSNSEIAKQDLKISSDINLSIIDSITIYEERIKYLNSNKYELRKKKSELLNIIKNIDINNYLFFYSIPELNLYKIDLIKATFKECN